MRIIAFGDLHMAVQVCRKIPDISTADMLIATGDLTNYGKKKDAKIVLEELLEINPNLLAIIGNLDKFEINDYLEQLNLNLHGQARLLQSQVCVIGAGGSNITPFGTPSEFSEQEITEILMSGYQQGLDYIALSSPGKLSKIPIILISHAPPHNTAVDRLTNGRHVGSVAVRKFIETYQPDLCITGHIHEGRGEDMIGKTRILNPGMLQYGGWVNIEFNKSTLHATLK
ncbi:metallophosphoesterase family protein [Desulfosediminicola flagellatus]|uniref:metallophosphoesterase family protein n=1 Tax=Desulfosediminicola flagellatus TaxID=2569541 RepID=UPI0010AD52B4|nr:metallophosphoesterase [Desulfosediminicola flagellatus]